MNSHYLILEKYFLFEVLLKQCCEISWKKKYIMNLVHVVIEMQLMSPALISMKMITDFKEVVDGI